LALLFLGAGATARAHIPSGYDLRAVHFVRKHDGLHGYYRLTLPLVVANRLGAKRPDANYEPAPFTVLRIESRHGFYYPDAPRIRAEPLALGQLIAEGHRLEVDATVREAQSVIGAGLSQGSGATVQHARAGANVDRARAWLPHRCARSGRRLRGGGCASAVSDGGKRHGVPVEQHTRQPSPGSA